MWYKGVFIFMPALYSYSNAFGYLFIIINLLVGNKVQGYTVRNESGETNITKN